MNLIKDVKEMVGYSKEGILSKTILKTSELDITLFCMAAGTKISEHTSTKKGFVYIIEGKGYFHLEGENIDMKPGIFISMKEKAVHSLEVERNTSFILVLI